MPVSLSVKNVPDEVVAKLRDKAAQKHRSLQGELLSILEESVATKTLSLDELAAEIKSLGLTTPDEATTIVRKLRDGR